MQRASVVLIMVTVSACAMDEPSADVTNAPTRPLTPAEQAALGHQIALTLKDPDSAQFQWPPVILAQRNGFTDYCGFVNAKNAMGGYSGFSEYYARLYPDATGAFTKAYVQAMGEDSDDYSTGVASTACKMAGYGSITLQ